MVIGAKLFGQQQQQPQVQNKNAFNILDMAVNGQVQQQQNYTQGQNITQGQGWGQNVQQQPPSMQQGSGWGQQPPQNQGWSQNNQPNNAWQNNNKGSGWGSGSGW